MDNHLAALIVNVRSSLYRFELVRKKLKNNELTENNFFNGPFGTNNKNEFEKKIDDAGKVVAVLEELLKKVETIITRESRMSSSKKIIAKRQ